MRGYAENVYLVRKLVDHAVEVWRMPDDVRNTGRLILTELATNAARLYEGKELRVWAAIHPGDLGVLEMAVWDPDPYRPPVILPMTEYGESGRGLALVSELSKQRLGWYRSETTSGKVVWARTGP